MAEQRFSIPLTRPWLDDRDAAAAGRAILSGWVTQGPRGRCVRAVNSPAPPAHRTRLRGLELHCGAASGAEGSGSGARRRGCHGQPLVHRDRKQRSLLRGGAGLRRYRAGHLQHRSAARRAGHHRTDTRHPLRASDGDALRPGGALAGCPQTWPPADRGRRVRHRQPGRSRSRLADGSARPTPISPASRFTRANS